MFVILNRIGDKKPQGYDVQRIALILESTRDETRLVYEMDNTTRDIYIAEPVATVTEKVNAVRERLAKASRPRVPVTSRRATAPGRKFG